MSKKLSIILCLALLFQLLPVLSVSAAAPTAITTILEENDSRLLYEGTWNRASSNSYYNGGATFSSDRAAAVHTSFTGTGFRYIGTLAANHQPLEIWIDGVLHTTIPTYSKNTKNKQKLFETENLPYGNHDVRILVAGGNTGKASSNIISVDRIEFIVKALAVPEGVSISQDDQNVTVSWRSATSALSYNVYRSIKGSSATVKINGFPIKGTRFVDEEVKLASIPSPQTVNYQVSAVGDGGIESELSSIKSINLPSNNVKAPSGLKAHVRASNAVSLTWKEEDDAKGYRIYRSDTKDGEYELIGDEFLNPTPSFTDLDIQTRFYPAKTAVYYKISAVGQYNESVLTSAVSITMNATQGPSNLVADTRFDDVTNEFIVSLQWKSVDGAVGYKVYHNSTGKSFTPLDDQIVVGGMTEFSVENRNLNKDSKNTYAVAAVDSSGQESALSRSVDIVIPKSTASTPKNFRASNVNNVISLSWSPSASAVGYKVFRSSHRDRGYTLISGDQLITNTAFVDSSFAQLALPLGTQYFYKIQAVNRFGEASTYNHHVTVSRKAPSSPQPVEINYSDRLLTLQWPQVAGAVQYKVYTYVQSRHSYSLVRSETVTSNSYLYEFQDKHQPTDLRYYYAVSAKDNAGNESSLSHKKSLLIENTVPGVPSRLKYVNNNNAITLSWSASKHATGYNIYRSTKKNGNSYVLVNQDGPINATEYVDLTYDGLNMQSTVKAYYKVTAVNRFNVQSQQSSILTATLTTPQGPDITSTELMNDHLTISWNPVQGATGYVLLRSQQSNRNFVPVADLTSNTYEDYVAAATFTADTTYYYVVKSKDALGRESKNSNVASAIVLGNIPSVPVSVTAAVYNNSNVTLEWMRSDHAASYNVYKQDASGTFVQLATGVTGLSYTEIVITEETTNNIYAISAVNLYGTESDKSEQAAATVEPPSIPQNLSVASDGSTANLAWEAVDGAKEYRIYRSTQAEMGFTSIGTASDTNYGTQLVTDTVETDFNYYYAVSAVYPEGHESALSNIGSAAVSANTASAPSLNNYSVTVSHQVTLNWDSSNRAVAYNIYRRSITDNTEFSLVNVSGPVTGTSYVDAQLTNSDDILGDSFGYIVKALNAYDSESMASNELQVLITAPIIPDQVTATVSVAGDSVIVNWSESDGAIGYRVYRSNNDGDTYTLISTEIINGVSYNDPFNFTMPEGIAFEYAVTAVYHPNYETHKSASASVFIIANSAAIPENVTVVVNNDETTVSWDASTNAIGYKVYRQQNGEQYQLLSGTDPITTTTYIDESLNVFHDEDIEIKYAISATNQYYSESAKSEEATLFIQASPKLTLTAVCSMDATVTRSWRIVNDNTFSVTFTLKVDGSTQSTVYTIAANSELFVDTVALAGTNTGTIVVNGVVHSVKENVGAECAPPIEYFDSGLILNGSFENYTGTNGVADDWQLSMSTGAIGNLAVVTDPITIGSKSQKVAGSIISSGGAVIISQKVTVAPEHIVTVRGKYNVESLNNARLHINVDYYDDLGNLLASNLKQQLTTTSGYIELDNTRISPIGTTHMKVSIILRAVGSNASGTIYVDSLQTITRDVGAPTVIQVDPVNGALSVPAKKHFTIIFNEAIQPGTNFSSVRLNTGAITVPITTQISGNVLTVEPTTQLEYEKVYSLYIPIGGLKDVAGNAMTKNLITSFTTEINSDFINGDFESYTGSNGVADNWTLFKSAGAIGNFEIVANPVSSGAKAQKISGSNIPNGGAVLIKQKVAVEPKQVVTVRGKYNVISLDNARLQINVDYYDIQNNLLVSNLKQQLVTTDGYIEIDNTRSSPPDSAYMIVSITLRAVGSNASGMFYVDSLQTISRDVGAPTVVSVDPLNGSLLIPVNKVISVTFNEAIQAGANISGVRLNTGAVTAPVAVHISGNVLTIVPSTELQYDKVYSLYIPVGGVTDLSGNATLNSLIASFTTQLNTNIINGGFEKYTGINGVADGWTMSKTFEVVENLELISTPVAEGVSAQKLAGSNMAYGGAVLIKQKVAVEAGRIVTVNGTYNVTSLDNARLQIQVDYYDAQNNLLVSNLKQQLTTTDGYMGIDNTRSSPVNTAYVIVSILLRSVGSNASGTIYVDSLNLSLR